MSTRREFVTFGSAAAFLAGRGRVPASAVIPSVHIPGRASIRDYDPATLATAALDAARKAGAIYADVRFTFTREESLDCHIAPPDGFSIYEQTERGIGVRAWRDGAWGFAASPLWTMEEAARLGRDAAGQATINAVGRPRSELDPRPLAVKGTWRTPIQRDPFTVSLAEKLDVLRALAEAPSRLDLGMRSASGTCRVRHRRQDKTFVSTDGSFLTQTLFLVDPVYRLEVGDLRNRFASCTYDRLQPTAGGWEVFNDPTLVDGLPQLIEEASGMLDAEPLEQPDRSDVVFDALALTQMVGRSIGLATELDRALGYEANADGTSYLAPVEEMLGRFALGPALLNVTANRSQPGGVSTVQWDDDGVVPERYSLIRNGTLVNYHTTRELAPLLRAAASDDRADRRMAHSHGDASADGALGVPMVQPPNIIMEPGTQAATLETLVADLERGLVVCGAPIVRMDRQQLNGVIGYTEGVTCYEVRKGKRVRPVKDWVCLVRAPEFWKNLQAVGGAGTQRWSGVMGVPKGQPGQTINFGVATVPARIKGVAVTHWRNA